MHDINKQVITNNNYNWLCLNPSAFVNRCISAVSDHHHPHLHPLWRTPRRNPTARVTSASGRVFSASGRVFTPGFIHKLCCRSDECNAHWSSCHWWALITACITDRWVFPARSPDVSHTDTSGAHPRARVWLDML